MATGWVRAYSEENKAVKTKVSYFQREDRAKFRSKFSTPLRKSQSDSSAELAKLKWGDTVELPNGLNDDDWTKVIAKGKTGFVDSSHLVEIAYVRKRSGSSSYNFQVKMDVQEYDSDSGKTFASQQSLIWGDLVQITNRGPKRCEVRVRGTEGKMDTQGYRF